MSDLANTRWPDLTVEEVDSMRADANNARRYWHAIQAFAHRTGALVGQDVLEWLGNYAPTPDTGGEDAMLREIEGIAMSEISGLDREVTRVRSADPILADKIAYASSRLMRLKNLLRDAALRRVSQKEKGDVIGEAARDGVDAAASLVRAHAEKSNTHWKRILLWAADQIDTLKGAALTPPASEPRDEAEQRVLAVRGSYDAPGFDACVEAELRSEPPAPAVESGEIVDLTAVAAAALGNIMKQVNSGRLFKSKSEVLTAQREITDAVGTAIDAIGNIQRLARSRTAGGVTEGMVEAAAQAMRDDYQSNRSDLVVKPWRDIADGLKEMWRRHARAALRACLAAQEGQ